MLRRPCSARRSSFGPQTKASQQQAAYQPEPKGGFACEMCAQFRPPHDCEIVAGAISPHGWCKFFELLD